MVDPASKKLVPANISFDVNEPIFLATEVEPPKKVWFQAYVGFFNEDGSWDGNDRREDLDKFEDLK
jgi:hypothetical protein